MQVTNEEYFGKYEPTEVDIKVADQVIPGCPICQAKRRLKKKGAKNEQS